MELNKEEIISILKENEDRLKKQYYIKKIYLFGSVSRNEVANDIDIMIEDIEPFDLFVLIRLTEELETMFNSKVDIVRKDGISKKFYNTIADDLIAI